ncbi:hypothetical protein [Occallatibacter riparius]|uniref:Uncharacterized protein n=1 Tax=Occallatibacter riparius TaxID=1002689 RepID=A0A9J7BNF1_9BACT|nr:hypothetical protein [Occallatibacter riparius]UWZ84041.1 hypothetical protein MOP44_26220 [Occallatibacter riparius]
MSLIDTKRFPAFYRTIAILPFGALMLTIRFFFPGAGGRVWDALVFLTLGWGFGVALFGLYQVLRSR